MTAEERAKELNMALLMRDGNPYDKIVEALLAAESTARKKALEEAAKVADTWSGERGFVSPVDAVDLCADLAETIRGLIEEKPQ